VSQELEVGLGAASLVLVSLKQGGGGDEAGYGGVGKMANCSYWNQLLLSGCRLVARRMLTGTQAHRGPPLPSYSLWSVCSQGADQLLGCSGTQRSPAPSYSLWSVCSIGRA